MKINKDKLNKYIDSIKHTLVQIRCQVVKLYKEVKASKCIHSIKLILKNIKYQVDKLYRKAKELLKNKSIENWKIVLGIILLLIVVICIYMPKEKEEKFDITKYPKNSFKGDDFVTKVYPIFEDVEIIGDSYSYFLGCDTGNDLTTYACPGLKLEELKNTFNAACKANKKYAVIFIGPNDLRLQTDIDTFKEYLVGYIQKLKENNKIVFIFTYLKSEFTDAFKEQNENGIIVEEYDNAIQEVCKEENATYINIKYMNNYHKDQRQNSDGTIDIVHFNKEFNVKLINRIYGCLYDMIVEEDENK